MLCRVPQRAAHLRTPRVQRGMTFTALQSVAAYGANCTAEQSKALPQRPDSKTIYLIRHGEGWHNVGYDHNIDAHLTPRGWAQTAMLQQHLAALQPQLNIQLVVVSPLRRTLETAAGVFGAKAPPSASANTATLSPAAPTATTAAMGTGAGSGAHLQALGDNNNSSSSSSAHAAGWILMHPQQYRPQEVTQQVMLYLPSAPSMNRRAMIAAGAAGAMGAACDAVMGGVPTGAGAAAGAGATDSGDEGVLPLKMLAQEGCRERIGPNVCDKFRDINLQAKDFPGVDFSQMQHSTDVEWERLHAATCSDGGCYLTGEEESACEQRALDFYKWIMNRPESVIAVVSHCGFLAHGMCALGKAMFSTWNDAMLLQCNAAGAGAPGAAAAENAGAAAAAAEALRLSAADMAGRMSVDWMNCECRSIELRWGSMGDVLTGPAAAMAAATAAAAPGQANGKDGVATTAAATGEGTSAQQYLYARPGDALTWWPGGLYGLQGGLYGRLN